MKLYDKKANGKFLLSAEYLVLDGAQGLALPLKKGQRMVVERERRSNSDIIWESMTQSDKVWFHTEFNLSELDVEQEDSTVKRLFQLFSHLSARSELFDPTYTYRFRTYLDFPRKWGLGTSSTLVALLADFAEIDPYALQFEVFGGSGYDIACAFANSPLLYQKSNPPMGRQVAFHPDFSDRLFFVYLNEKRNSREAISAYRKKSIPERLIRRATEISNELLDADYDGFCDLLREHENMLSEILEVQTMQSALFHDFPGVIKSLGAWGGDFVLAVANEPENAEDYFKSRGFEVVFSYDSLVINAPKQ